MAQTTYQAVGCGAGRGDRRRPWNGPRSARLNRDGSESSAAVDHDRGRPPATGRRAAGHSFLPSLLERRLRGKRCLVLHGVSTGKFYDLVKGAECRHRISKSAGWHICADLDGEVGTFWDRLPPSVAYGVFAVRAIVRLSECDAGHARDAGRRAVRLHRFDHAVP